MRARRTRALVALNAVLLLTLGAVTLGPVAAAQDGASRPRGEYTLVGGAIRTGNSNAIYILDSVNQELVVMRWNDSRNRLDGIGYRSLTDDAARRPGR